MRAWLALVIAVVVTLLIRGLRWTWRLRVVGEPPKGACLFAFWHGHQLALTAAPISPAPAVLVSRSRDGQWAARVARWLGYSVVRGSTSRGAVAGALGLARRLLGGQKAAIAVDGPRGPGYRTSDSAMRLARRVAVPLVPVTVSCTRGLRLSTWDRMLIPAPFAAVRVCFGSPVSEGAAVPEGAAGGRLQRALEAAASTGS